MKLTGNIVSGNEFFFGEIAWENGKITSITSKDVPVADADLILPGFIDIHLHGLGNYSTMTPEDVCGMAEFAPACGITGLLPAFASAPEDFLLKMLAAVREICACPPQGAVIAGSHLEGPFLSHTFKGGMIPEMLRLPDINEVNRWLEAAQGTLKLVTIAPELPGAKEVIRLLASQNITVSAGHSACPPELFPQCVEWGVSQVCHLFDAYDIPENPGGVRSPALTDLALIDDRVMKELIVDGLHVPPELVILTRRAAGAEHITAISDAMQGAGLKEGRFEEMGVWYTIKDGDVARRESDNAIVGSSLGLNRGFYNMTRRFGFSEVEAVTSLSKNPARICGIGDHTGTLLPGFDADIAQLAPDHLTVRQCFVRGVCKYQS